ncbi:MAG: glutamate synthase subunit beta [Candidatus Omnitrophota bacterium]
MKVKRQSSGCRPKQERVKDYSEAAFLSSEESFQEQSSRCMDCGTPFCHWGCPLGNYMPEWNDLVFRGHWQKALQLLSARNNFPEITGRLCPALCEYACVLGINDDPVTIRENELALVEYGFSHGLISARPAKKRSGKKIAVVGSGPAGLACADQLNQAGHKVVVFEKDEAIGGILRFGIPDFKLEKRVIDRRLEILKKEGIEFAPGVNAGIDFSARKLSKDFDALLLAAGCRVPRDLNIQGRQLKGIHFAMEYLTQSNRRLAGKVLSESEIISAKGKKVVVIGGGDTGADCVGTAHRQGAIGLMQIEIMPQPPLCRSREYPWPSYPLILKTSSSHEEGGLREWSVSTKKFIGENGRIKKLLCQKDGVEFQIEADLVILALGFLRPENNTLLEELKVEFDTKGNVKTSDFFITAKKGVFSCGDMRRGQSLVAWAIYEGRQAAQAIGQFLK